MSLLELENRCLEEGYSLIAGVDEVGRGPLAGPVCAAAVILPVGMEIEGVNDSKKLTEKKRELLYDVIAEKAIAWSVSFVEPEIIDEINIRQATHLAMEKAVSELVTKPDFLLVDGNDKIPFPIPSAYVVKGDAKSHTIAAASIMAKVTRDRYMVEMGKKYPEYCFEKHKGYGTAVHMEAIRKHGLTPLHRRSFITAKVMGKA